MVETMSFCAGGVSMLGAVGFVQQLNDVLYLPILPMQLFAGTQLQRTSGVRRDGKRVNDTGLSGQDRQSEDVRAQIVLTAKSGAIGPLRMVLSTNSKVPPRNSRCSIRNEPNTAGLVTSFTTKHEMTTPL